MATTAPTTPNDDDTLEITLIRASRPVKVTDLDGTVRNLTLKEMTGANRDRWLNKMTKRSKTNAKGESTGISEFDGIQAELITNCLYDEDDKQVPMATLAQWPASTQNALFKACEKMNGLGKDEAEEAVKND